MSLDRREIVLGVTGSIAAYKAALLVRELRRLGAGVTVVMTEHAREFITPLTFRTLSGRPVLTDLFDPQEPWAVEHVALAERADLVVIAPATASTIARLALGLADDFLGTLLLATRAPVLLAPAMDGEMWRHPALQGHVLALRSRGVTVMEPEHGELASGLVGPGRLPEVSDIAEMAMRITWPTRDLTADHVVVTAGPTREGVDPVRYLTNRSSGRMGYALATIAARRGAQVTLVTGPTALAVPTGIHAVPVETAEQMRTATVTAAHHATVVVMAAAVADYRVMRPPDDKIRSGQSGLTLELVPNPDILAELGRAKGTRFLVGFAAEQRELLDSARRKLVTKGVDIIVANDVSRPGIGFDSEHNEVVIMDRWGGVVEVPRRSKAEIAGAILDRIQALRRAQPVGMTPRRETAS